MTNPYRKILLVSNSNIKNFDVGVVGTSLGSALMAGLLARDHKQKTCLFLNQSAQHQLSREIGLSFNCAARPETWTMQNQAVAEALPILTKIGGANALKKTSGLLVCQNEYTADFLSHMYHYLHAIDYEIERLAHDEYTNCTAAYEVGNLRLVRPSIVWPALINWLNVVGVSVFDWQGLRVGAKKKGNFRVNLDQQKIDLGQLVLADEESILAFGGNVETEPLFEKRMYCTVLTQPLEKGRNPLIINPEHEFCARARPDGAFEVICEGSFGQLERQFSKNILANGILLEKKILLAGRAIFPSIRTADGAPFAGFLNRSNVWGCAGFGQMSLFFAPMLARLICSESSANEATYFALRGIGKKRNNAHISDGCARLGGDK